MIEIKKTAKNLKCTQCGEKMTYSYGNKEWFAPFCSRASCPNYGLLQTGVLPKKEGYDQI
jgi:hypothetical protein